MYCTKCGRALPQGARFCPGCGSRLELAVEEAPDKGIREPGNVTETVEKVTVSAPDSVAAADSTGESNEAEGKDECVKCGEEIPEDAVLCSYCGSWQEKGEAENMEGVQKKTVDRRAFIAIGVVAVLLIAALIIVSGIISSMLENSKPLELRPEPEEAVQASSAGVQSVYNGQYLVVPDYELMCPLDVLAGGERSYYVYLEYIGEPENSYDPRQPSTSSPGEEDMSFYVEAGNSAELYVPVGEYYAYYASGYDWQGPEALFGEDTVCNMDAYILEFYTDEESVYGYDLELWDDAEDNPDMVPISPEDFPR